MHIPLNLHSLLVRPDPRQSLHSKWAPWSSSGCTLCTYPPHPHFCRAGVWSGLWKTPWAPIWEAAHRLSILSSCQNPTSSSLAGEGASSHPQWETALAEQQRCHSNHVPGPRIRSPPSSFKARILLLPIPMILLRLRQETSLLNEYCPQHSKWSAGTEENTFPEETEKQ